MGVLRLIGWGTYFLTLTATAIFAGGADIGGALLGIGIGIFLPNLGILPFVIFAAISISGLVFRSALT
jgi:hypothetical protein